MGPEWHRGNSEGTHGQAKKQTLSREKSRVRTKGKYPVPSSSSSTSSNKSGNCSNRGARKDERSRTSKGRAPERVNLVSTIFSATRYHHQKERTWKAPHPEED
ncbi:hypothetical protein TNCV_3696781 [Trichonephila clavipes]|uniref:Uncharacterized protein n=1 Tax=Trichonephila clavipes TaxID=2585209 RepID=A0A8X6SAT7_TRICX|nr:hypothetical protein TNCV_3696781 [Trichonephila clavipes]